MWFEGRAREEAGGREGGEGERGKGGGREGAGRDVVRVYSAASATSLGVGNTGHTPDPPQQNPTVRQNVFEWVWKDVVVEGGEESGNGGNKRGGRL